MIDREKVIKAFRTRIISDSEEYNTVEIPVNEAEQILSLLEKQEAVKPHISRGTWWFQCGKCKTPIDYGDRFCRHCGQEAKWE